MEYWFQRILLVTKQLTLLCLSGLFYTAQAQESDKIDSEYFDVGLFTGILNIEDFNSEFITGINATFNANENYFVQFNYLQTDASLSSFEESQGALFSGSDRTFTHFDFLVGYNLFQGEHFLSGNEAKLSSLYLVSGVGDTEFGGEDSFTYTLGVGYQIAVQRDLLLKFDFRDYIYKTNIIGENKSAHNTQLSIALSYSF
ncbi:outer membrane beta-barrel domain-containing protein [Aliikangiella marina]|uniref:Outer membrane beta-barrel domain-containing protein n=1 Tax=Aliikangiella marina TaxID=1712262 RepID=A0A545TI79_9GAMM|nr:outer membrane beta-barrel domain-containing protein [Aliikangiella marina]TQV76934.1 outer membrane beta-barrel domain-containing protein [Aliikangiella marina]